MKIALILLVSSIWAGSIDGYQKYKFGMSSSEVKKIAGKTLVRTQHFPDDSIKSILSEGFQSLVKAKRDNPSKFNQMLISMNTSELQLGARLIQDGSKEIEFESMLRGITFIFNDYSRYTLGNKLAFNFIQNKLQSIELTIPAPKNKDLNSYYTALNEKYGDAKLFSHKLREGYFYQFQWGDQKGTVNLFVNTMGRIIQPPTRNNIRQGAKCTQENICDGIIKNAGIAGLPISKISYIDKPLTESEFESSSETIEFLIRGFVAKLESLDVEQQNELMDEL